MWVFTTYGMLSAVQHRAKKNVLCVRAREPKVLEMFCKRNGIKPSVRKTVQADYMYRMEFAKPEFAKAMMNEIFNISYPNFKGACNAAEKKNTNRYHNALLDVWTVMRREQEEIEFGSIRKKGAERLPDDYDPWFDEPEIHYEP